MLNCWLETSWLALNDDILDAELRHSIGLHRLATGIIGRIITLLDSMDADLYDIIRKRDPFATTGQWSFKRIKLLLEDVRQINKEAYQLVNKELSKQLKDLAVYEAGFQLELFDNVIPIRLRFRQPTTEQLHAAVTENPFEGALLKEWVAGMEDGRYTRLRNAIRISFAGGETIDQMIRRVRGTASAKFKDGVLDISRRSAETLTRTAVNHVAVAARQLIYESNSSMIKGIQWVSTLDLRTTPICRARDGKVFPVNEGPRPPAHLNCRSTTVPVVKSWKELGIDIEEAPEGTRASMNGQVAAKLTYGDWLRKQSVQTQDEVMGIAKATLFRKGGLDMDRFVDQTGRAYTLDELRTRESEAWTRAGLKAA
jgi:SPP1 gp7 family putative phage head morphogenesis protein